MSGDSMVDVIFGTDRFLVKKQIESIERQIKKDYGDFEYLSFNSSDSDFRLDQVYESVMTLSLFGERKLVVFFIDNDKDLAKLDEAMLFELLQTKQFEINLVFVMDKKPLAKTKVRKIIDTHTKVHDIKKASGDEVGRFVKERMQHYNVQMDNMAQRLFIQRIQNDLVRAEVELQKLSVLDGVVTLSHVESLVSQSFDDAQFALSNALMDRNLKEAFAVYHRLLENKMDPLALLGMVASSLRGVYQVMVLAGEGFQAQSIADISGMSIGQVRFVQRSQRRNPKEVLNLLNELADLDQKAKLGLIDRHLSFEMFMLRLK